MVLIDTGSATREQQVHRHLRASRTQEQAGAPNWRTHSHALGHGPKTFAGYHTHLHFDHAGGNLSRAGLSFPARYVVQRASWSSPVTPNERTAGSYPGDIRGAPVQFIDGERKSCPASAVSRPPARPLPPVDPDRERRGKRPALCGSRADAAHLPLSWIMATTGTTRHARGLAAAVPAGRGRRSVARVRDDPRSVSRSLSSRGQGFWTCPTDVLG